MVCIAVGSTIPSRVDLKYKPMAKHWPYKTELHNLDQERSQLIIKWCLEHMGQLSWQHWSSDQKKTLLTVYFCDKAYKTYFDLNWC
jgi:hypothetical protein